MENHYAYIFVPLEGSAYQIGQRQAVIIQQNPALRASFTSTPQDWISANFANAASLYREYCPGLEEELQGVADGLKVPPGQLFYNLLTYLKPIHCSHFALKPEKTTNGHTLVGRNYDFGPESEDMRLCLTRPQGKFHHLAFSSLLLGRSDGMNDQGLVLTMSAGGIPVGSLPGMTPPMQTGLQFWAVGRSVLENCASVAQAVDWLKHIPCGGNPIYLLADRSGQAAKVEIHGAEIAIEYADPYVYATNHYTSAELAHYTQPPMPNSVVRAQRIQELINQHPEGVSAAAMRQLMSTRYPDGLCNHFYQEMFGTLYSFIADPQDGRMDICFGSPAVNSWHTFTLSQPNEAQTYPVKLPQASGFREFWG
jgi:predicted choloylglycine hydrolase